MTTQAPLRVYSWADYGVAGVAPMVWADFFGGSGSAVAAAVAPALLARPADGRVVFLRHVGEGSLFAAGPVDVWTNGCDVAATLRWCRDFFAGLAAAGVNALDYVALDQEEGVGYDGLGDAAAFVAEMQSTPAGLAALPAEVRAATPAEAADFRGRPDLVAAINVGADVIKGAGLTRAVGDALDEFYPGTPRSNYESTGSAFACVDKNDRLIPPHPLTFGAESAPALYGIPGGRAAQLGYAGDDAVRLRWLGDLAIARSIELPPNSFI